MAHAIVMPSYGMYTAEGTLVRWLKPSGAAVASGEVVAEIETEKALADVTAPSDGMLHHVAVPGALLQVESLIGYVLDRGESPPDAIREPPAGGGGEAALKITIPSGDSVPASPNVRRLAAELGVELSRVIGTGLGGRVSEDDVRAAAENAT